MREYGPPSGHFAFARRYAADCLAGLSYLESHGMAHGAIVPRNIRFLGGRAVLCNIRNIVGDLIGYAHSAARLVLLVL